MNQQFRNVVYLADRGGTGFWRHTQQMMLINCYAQNLNIQYDCVQTPIFDQNYYKGMTSVTCQRWISDQQKDLFCKYLKSIMDNNCGWLIYAIDDNMAAEHIPLYNRGRAAFESKKTQDNIREMLNTADFVVTTTEHIKNFYHEYYGVPLENIIAAPNLLPKWWFGDRYDPEKKVAQFKRFKAKPRIGIISSLSHYNVDDVRQDANGKAVRKQTRPDGTTYWQNEQKQEVKEEEAFHITDDIDEVLNCIRETVNDVQWVFCGYCPPSLSDLVEKNKIEVHHGVDILNYPSMLENLQLQAIVAPIKDMEFNRCKSHIKYMECAAIGVPLFASDYLPYNRVMPKNQLFKTGDQLKKMLLDLKFKSVGAYASIIDAQWKWLNAKQIEGDFELNGYWLENNMSIWVDMLRMKSKTLTVSMNSFAVQYEARKKIEDENTIFKNDNIQILK